MTDMTETRVPAPEKHWYVVHTYSGYENKVKTNLEHRILSMHMQDKIFEVVVPVEDVLEYKSGKKQLKKPEEDLLPVYLLVEDGPGRRLVVRGAQHAGRDRLRRHQHHPRL